MLGNREGIGSHPSHLDETRQRLVRIPNVREEYSALPSASLDTTGILIVGRDFPLQSGSPNGGIQAAFDRALRTTKDYPNDLGYPWIDPLTSYLVVSASNAHGRALLQGANFGAPTRIRDVAHSSAELLKIQDDATRLYAEGVTDAGLIYQSGPDQRDNRTSITIARFSRPLLDELARRFPPDALIVVVDPTRYPLEDTVAASPTGQPSTTAPTATAFRGRDCQHVRPV